jgi:hypothetical protein
MWVLNPHSDIEKDEEKFSAAVATQHLSSLLKAPPPATMVEAAVFTMTLLRRKKRQKEKREGEKKSLSLSLSENVLIPKTGALVGAGSQGPDFLLGTVRWSLRVARPASSRASRCVKIHCITLICVFRGNCELQ